MLNKDYYLLLSIFETIKKILLYSKDINQQRIFITVSAILMLP